MKPVRFRYERADARGLVHFIGGASEDRQSATRLLVFMVLRLVVGISLVVRGLYDHGPGGISVGVILVVWAAMSAYVTFRIENIIRRFGRLMSETPEIELFHSDDGIVSESGGNTSRIAWNEIEGLGEDENAIYIRIKDNCLLVPKRAFFFYRR